LRKQGKLAEAVACYRQALRLKPDLPEAHYNLGAALLTQGKLGEAVAAYKEAIRLKPAFPEAHCNLGNALLTQGKPAAAVAAFKEALRLKPDLPLAHYNLGNALWKQGKLAEAVACYRQALRLKPDYPEAHCNLGIALRDQGKPRESLAALRRGHALGAQTPGWSHPSARWVREARRLVQLDNQLPAILQGEAKPKDASEQVELARLCALKSWHAASARFYADAFSARPAPAPRVVAAHRFNAACSAALAGCGRGEDKPLPTAEQRAGLRRQALDWLRAALADLAKQAEKGDPQARAAAAGTLRHWKQDPDLAGVRDKDALGKLPEEERKAWGRLWAEVAALQSKAALK
jgi:Flp pilus assembly protein TadD